MNNSPKQVQDMNTNDIMQELPEEAIFLVKNNGVWQMQIIKNGEVKVAEGKELVIALMDAQNPLAATYVDGEILDSQYNSLYVKFNNDKEIKNHNCFNATDEDIMNVLNNDGLVLALSPQNMPRTEKFNQYLEENNINLDIDTKQ